MSYMNCTGGASAAAACTHIVLFAVADGRWVSGRRRVLVADSRLVDRDGEEIGRGTGTFMRSRIPLSGLPGYRIG